MKSINEVIKETYWMELYDLVESMLEDYRKLNNWRKWTEEREEKALRVVANNLNVRYNELYDYWMEG